MLGACQVQNGMFDCYKKIGRLPPEFARQRRLAQVLDQIIANQTPKLARRNPHTAAPTDNLCRSFAAAGHSPTRNVALMGIFSGKRLGSSSEKRARVYTQPPKIT